MKATRMSSAPCATLMMFMTPKISVSPLAISAYTPPISNPSTSAWTSWVMRSSSGSSTSAVRRPGRCPGSVRGFGAAGPGDPCEHGPPGGGSLPGRLGDDLVDSRCRLRCDDLRRAALPLGEEEVLGRGSGLVPGERPENGLHLVLVQPLGHLVLVYRADRLGRRLDHLCRRVGVRGVLGGDAAVVPLGVLVDELLVVRGV